MCTSNDDIVTRYPCPNIAQHTPSYRADKSLPHRGATGPWAEADAILIDFVVRANASRPKAAKVMELALLSAAACPFLARAAAAAAALLVLEIFNRIFGFFCMDTPTGGVLGVWLCRSVFFCVCVIVVDVVAA